VRLYGRGIGEPASDAAGTTNPKSDHSRFTTSEAEPSSPNSDSHLETLCCSVVNAIASFIPAETLSASSFSFALTRRSGWTDVPWNKKPHAGDGVRYHAIGNSMAVNVMSFIGRRIEAAL
jgi:hypothetical protein